MASHGTAGPLTPLYLLYQLQTPVTGFLSLTPLQPYLLQLLGMGLILQPNSPSLCPVPPHFLFSTAGPRSPPSSRAFSPSHHLCLLKSCCSFQIYLRSHFFHEICPDFLNCESVNCDFCFSFYILKHTGARTLAFQWLRLRLPLQGAMGSIPG